MDPNCSQTFNIQPLYAQKSQICSLIDFSTYYFPQANNESSDYNNSNNSNNSNNHNYHHPLPINKPNKDQNNKNSSQNNQNNNSSIQNSQNISNNVSNQINDNNLTIATFMYPIDQNKSTGVCFAMVFDVPAANPLVKFLCRDISQFLQNDIQTFTSDCELSKTFTKLDNTESLMIYPKIGIISGHNDAIKLRSSISLNNNNNKISLVNGRILELAEKMYFNRMIHEFLTFDGKIAYCGLKFPSVFIFLEKEIYQTKQESKNVPILKEAMNDFYSYAEKISLLSWDNN